MQNELGRNRHRLVIIFITAGLLLMTALFAIAVGSASYSLKQVVDALLYREDSMVTSVVWNLRLPRVLIAVFVGANLAVSGVLLQSVMGNPLADPGLTGISSGASLAAILIMLVFPKVYHLLSLGSFFGGAVACLMVYALAWKNGIRPLRIILAGVAVNAMLGGGTSLLSILYSDRIQGVLLWLNGSMSAKSWGNLSVLMPYSIIGLLLSILCIRAANLLLLGDSVAINLGAKINRMRMALSGIAVFLAGISVATVGVIGFVGLIVPHMGRKLVGADYRYLLPQSMVLGAFVLLLGDTLARTVAAPLELPVGVIMAVIGGPFFLYLLRKEDQDGHNT